MLAGPIEVEGWWFGGGSNGGGGEPREGARERWRELRGEGRPGRERWGEPRREVTAAADGDAGARGEEGEAKRKREIWVLSSEVREKTEETREKGSGLNKRCENFGLLY